VRALCANRLHVRSVFHAAHQLADAALANQDVLNFRATYGPKVHGGSALHAICALEHLHFFHLYSSVAGLLGSAGQTPHSAANTRLDALAARRHLLGVRGQSVAWGAVSTIGYAARHGADRRADVSGIGAVSVAMVSVRHHTHRILNTVLHGC
jgi:hypothetical protein